MLIGELADRTGVNPKTIRYYESVGLLAEAERSAGGYRLYGDVDAERLRVIRAARSIGLSVDQVRDVLTIADRGAAPCQHVRELIDQRLDQVRHTMSELQALEGQLLRLKSTPTNGEAPVCGVLTSITEHH